VRIIIIIFRLCSLDIRIGHRIRDTLKYLFSVPKEEATRVMSFVNDDDYISFWCAIYFEPISSFPSSPHTDACLFRHNVFVKTGKKEVQLAEVGPQFEMKRELCNKFHKFSSIQPTVPSSQRNSVGYNLAGGGDKEWVLSYYTRTARKRRVL
jgi:U3 small nucleolar ribonucleoprotein protein IMP4